MRGHVEFGPAPPVEPSLAEIRRIVQQETEVLRQRIAKLERRLDRREEGR